MTPRRGAGVRQGRHRRRQRAATAARSKRSARALLAEIGPDCDVVLLGSIASPKYVDVLTAIFGERLLFPIDFVGRGDMSRGGLLLRHARDGVELDYVPVLGAARHGSRPPKLPPLRSGRSADGCIGRPEGRIRRRPMKRLELPRDQDNVVLAVDGKDVRLTNLRKIFWPELGLTKGDLLQYYADVAGVLLPHIRDRAMVMKRYPHGAAGEFFFMKRAPSPRPPWIEICSIDHGSKGVIDFPMIQDRASLLWVINLGCIDLNQWYATLRRCRSAGLPAFRSRSRAPAPAFERVLETALVVREALDALKMPSLVKTTGSKGLHVYVPIVRGPDAEARSGRSPRRSRRSWRGAIRR